MLNIGDTGWEPLLLLAPMAGVTHSALRTLLIECGGVGLLSTEMLSARKLPTENQALSPWLIRTKKEKPLSYQLLVTQASEVQPAIEAVHRLEGDAVDINFGCPAPKVRKAGGGISLMSEPERVREIIRTCRRVTSLPLSAKIRLGERLNDDGLVDFCLMLQEEGVDMLCVHARLRKESFARKPHWEQVGRISSRLRIPVIANGGIFSVEDAARCLEVSGADGLMIGRAAAQKPWLFNEIAREIYGCTLPAPTLSLPGMYSFFVRGLLRFPPERRLGRLKEFTHYFAHNYAFGHHLAMSVQKSGSMGEAWQEAVGFFSRSDSEGLKTVQVEKVAEQLLQEEEVLL